MRGGSSIMTASTSPSRTRSSRPYEQIVIDDVQPSIDGGRFPVKAVAGEVCVVEATVFRHGHDQIHAVLRVYGPGGRPPMDVPLVNVNPGLDRWRGEFLLDAVGRFRFTILAWTDHFGSWVRELQKRVDAGLSDLASEVEEGIAQVSRAASGARGDVKAELAALLAQMRDASDDAAAVLAVGGGARALDLMRRAAARTDETQYAPDLQVVADRARARTGAWYELFVRSQGTTPGVSGTFADAERRLPQIRDLGFDVVYLAPIHPIGLTNRKAANNSVRATPADPGSPWAIGSAAGGHTAIEPALGTIDDFDRFIRAAHAIGLEVALDFAIQCSPDHPWVREHPDWFYRRPDGSIRYAENPPKKYEDIYPLNFDTADWRRLWDALRDVVRFWVSHGVRICRVDNPHTKPVGFWSWLIEQIQLEAPDVIFLAEAFTRPPMMLGLGQRGFTQSYTYFTWRNTKAELMRYMTELLEPDVRASYRPNFFANTPDILPPILQRGGRPAFQSRLVLAATLSPSYGIYSGYELCENQAIPGREEYLNSEKYEIKVRDWNAPGNLNDFIRRVNQARHEHPALQLFDNLRFLEVPDEHLLAYVKATPDASDVVIVVVNLDPFGAHASTVTVPAEAVGAAPGDTFQVHDVLTDQTFTWGATNHVILDPRAGEPAHLLVVRRDG
jgi:starch synthase (maltosyl-transferring)